MFTKENIERILKDVKSGVLSVKSAFSLLKALPYEDIGFAKIDNHRTIRKGFPEVIYAEGKTLRQLELIIRKVFNSQPALLITRVDKEIYIKLKRKFDLLEYSEEARMVYYQKHKPKVKGSLVAIVTAGTADIPVAEEASITLSLMGVRVRRVYDVGVAGIHRFFNIKNKLVSSKVIIVVAGMEGALASVVGGVFDKPIIAVPTSKGYGASFKGIAPLLTMLNSCAPGVAVMNIDNGFGAGYFAGMLVKKLGSRF